ncbi:hypothetical protein [Delftia tsuruhatensis]|uniref:hypothetical protein n=1 Tax=Delftia tsuruhatensis TaxID=180282 RepID=UPI001F4124AE|nr:hypothetical protein [Delftia tsuruhatensis]
MKSQCIGALAHERTDASATCCVLRATRPTTSARTGSSGLPDLSLRKRRLKLERVLLHECRTINVVLNMDFVSDSLASGRHIKCLPVMDDFSHECVDIAVDQGIGGQ